MFTSVRRPGLCNKVNLGMSQRYKGGPSEVDDARRHSRRLAAIVGEGVRALAYDGALSGVHVNAMMRDLGSPSSAPSRPSRTPNRSPSGKTHPSRVEKERAYETLRLPLPGGRKCRHELISRGGRLGHVVVDGRGDRNWVPLQINKLVRGGNPGAYRFYQMLTIPCPAHDDPDAGAEGSHSYRLPLVQTDDDTTKGFNRSEHLRQLRPDTTAYTRTYGRRLRRSPTNSQRERRYVFHRIPAYGPEQQTLVMLLGSLLDNIKSRWLHQRRQQAEQDAA